MFAGKCRETPHGDESESSVAAVDRCKDDNRNHKDLAEDGPLPFAGTSPAAVLDELRQNDHLSEADHAAVHSEGQLNEPVVEQLLRGCRDLPILEKQSKIRHVSRDITKINL